MTKYKQLPPLERLAAVFRVDEEGRLYWKARPNSITNISRIRVGQQVTTVNGEGYLTVGLDGSKYRVHRIVWALIYGEDPGQLQVDHINGDRTDNRPSNLRLCDNGQNQLNSKMRATNTSGIRGVYLVASPKDRPWAASYRNKRLGYFATKEDAAKAVMDAVELCGDKNFYQTQALEMVD